VALPILPTANWELECDLGRVAPHCAHPARLTSWSRFGIQGYAVDSSAAILWHLDVDEWPKTALDFERRFGTEEACVQYLEQLRWPSGFRCPQCGGDVEPGSIMRTDDWKGYGQLVSKGYGWNIVRRSTETGENLLPLVNRVASLVKRWLLGTHQGAVRPSHLDFYLDEYTFRFNRRTSGSHGKLFYRLLEQAVMIEPTRGADLKGRASALE